MPFDVRPIRPTDSISELTLLIRRAYKILADMGFNYTATYQDAAETSKRIAAGYCFVMTDAHAGATKLVDTVTLRFPVTPNSAETSTWYSRPGVASFGQFAVEPNFQKRGLGSQLMETVELRAAALGAAELALDTSEGAHHLIRFYEKRGYRMVDFVQYEGKSYRSVILSKTL